MLAARDAAQAERNPYAAQQRNDRVGQIRERIDQRQQDVRDDRDFRQSGRPVPNVMRDRHLPVVSNTPRPGTEPPLRGDSQRVRELNWNRNWQHDGAMIGVVTAITTGRCSTSDSTSIRSAGGISPTGSDTGCGQIITGTSSGSIRPSTACLTLPKGAPGSVTGMMRFSSIFTLATVLDEIPSFFW